jgi:hypothetical protein
MSCFESRKIAQLRSTHPERRSGDGGGGGWCQKAVQMQEGLAKHGVLPSLAIEESGPACVICSVADCGLHKVHLYLEYHSVCPLVGIGIPSPASEFALSPEPGGGGGVHTRLRVRVWGSPNSDDWRESLALCLLCGGLYCFPGKAVSETTNR